MALVGEVGYTRKHMGVRKGYIISARWSLAVIVATSLVLGALGVGRASAADAQFALQVTPSPLFATVKPGEKRSIEFQVRNNGSQTENLKAELRSFQVAADGSVILDTTAPKEVSGWVTFTQPTFTVRTGEWFTEHLEVAVPESAGFSYSFVVAIGRVQNEQPKAGTQSVVGSVGLFVLLNIDRPGAVRSFTATEFRSDKRVYEYLPGSFSVTFHNDGNTIVQPVGNVFIQRSSTSKPISTLPLNEAGSYLLPGVDRSLSLEWRDGFPVYEQTKSADNVPAKNHLFWRWQDADHFRFGRYTAKMVAVYNDGQKDVPIIAEVSFWVVPWRLLVVLFVVGLILIVGIVVIIRRVLRLGHRRRHHRAHQD